MATDPDVDDVLISSKYLQNLTISNDTRLPLDLYRAVPVSVLLAVIDLVTIFGNILVIVAVLKTRTLRQVTCNYYIVSLAASDLLLGIVVLPLSSVYEILDYWIFPSFFCVFWLCSDVLSCTASILNLLCISVDRYLAISRPLHYHKYSSPKFVYIMIGAAWILALLISVAPVFGFDQSGRSADQCKVAASGLFWTLYSSVGSFFMPLTIMLFLYYRIYLVAAKHSKFMKEERERFASFAQQREEQDGERNMSLEGSDPAPVIVGKSDNPRVSRVTIASGGTPQVEFQTFPKDSVTQLQRANSKKFSLMKKLRRMSKDKKAAKTLFIVMAVFIACWMPFFTIYLIDGVCKKICDIPSWTFKVFFWLGYCNSMLNPVIYAASSYDFRTAFRKILRCSVNQAGSDYFAEMDHRNQFSPSAQQPARPTGNGGLSGRANRLRQSITSHLIKKTRTARESATAANRFPPVGENHPLVVQQENGLLPITAGGQRGDEITNPPLQRDGSVLLAGASGAVDDSVKVPHNGSLDWEKTDSHGTKLPETSPGLDTVLSNYNGLASPCESLSPSNSPSNIQESFAESSSLDGRRWNKVKSKAKQMVAVFSDKHSVHGIHANAGEMNEKIAYTPRLVHVADVGITTADRESAEKCVQTSISFVNLGLI